MPRNVEYFPVFTTTHATIVLFGHVFSFFPRSRLHTVQWRMSGLAAFSKSCLVLPVCHCSCQWRSAWFFCLAAHNTPACYTHVTSLPCLVSHLDWKPAQSPFCLGRFLMPVLLPPQHICPCVSHTCPHRIVHWPRSTPLVGHGMPWHGNRRARPRIVIFCMAYVG